MEGSSEEKCVCVAWRITYCSVAWGIKRPPSPCNHKVWATALCSNMNKKKLCWCFWHIQNSPSHLTFIVWTQIFPFIKLFRLDVAQEHYFSCFDPKTSWLCFTSRNICQHLHACFMEWRPLSVCCLCFSWTQTLIGWSEGVVGGANPWIFVNQSSLGWRDCIFCTECTPTSSHCALISRYLRYIFMELNWCTCLCLLVTVLLPVSCALLLFFFGKYADDSSLNAA